MHVHLVDGTYELFRHHFGTPPRDDAQGNPVSAAAGVLRTLMYMLEEGATHLAVATDHVVESFRNDMYDRYKTSEGLEPAVLSQFPLVEEAIEAAGIKLFAMTDWEADDALGSVAVTAAKDPNVTKVFVCSPDKDLAQCVVGDRIVQLDRRRREVRNEEGVFEKFGVFPASIPDWLALVGDTSDGYPGLPGFGAKTAAALLARWGKLEEIPQNPNDWKVEVRGAPKLSATLRERWDDALLFRDLATLRYEPELIKDIEELRWTGPTPDLAKICDRLGEEDLVGRLAEAAKNR